MSSIDSEPSITEAHPFIMIRSGNNSFLIKKSAVIGLSINDEYMLIHVKHFEGNFIKLPFKSPAHRYQLVENFRKWAY